MPQVNVQNMPQQVDEIKAEEPAAQLQVEQPSESQENPQSTEQAPQPTVQESHIKTTSETQNTTAESTKPNNLPDIAEEVTQEAATLFDSEDDSDVWKV